MTRTWPRPCSFVHAQRASVLPIAMDSRRLFVQLADAGSYAAVSRELGIARTTAMRRVAALEQELGLTLTQVAGNTLVLTSAGRRLAAEWRRIIERQDRIEQEVRRASGQTAGTLRIRMPVMGTPVAIVPALADFSREHPEIQLLIQQGWDPQDLRPGEFDVAMRIHQHPVDPDLRVQKLFDLRLILVASPAYLDAHGPLRSVADFPQHRAIQEWDRLGRLLPWRLQDGTRVALPPVAVRAHGTGHVIGFALAGAGIALVPDVLADTAIEQGLLRQVVPEVHTPTTSSLVYLPDPSPTVRAFLAYMAERIRKRPNPSYDPSRLEWR